MYKRQGYAIASSPRERGLLWAGTNDGKVWYTRNGGGNWVDVSANLKGMPDLGTITQIWPSTFDAATAIVTVDGPVSYTHLTLPTSDLV